MFYEYMELKYLLKSLCSTATDIRVSLSYSPDSVNLLRGTPDIFFSINSSLLRLTIANGPIGVSGYASKGVPFCEEDQYFFLCYPSSLFYIL